MDMKQIKKLAKRLVKAARPEGRISLREVVQADRANYPELIGEVMKLARRAPQLQLVA